jgi:hypothetical protein
MREREIMKKAFTLILSLLLLFPVLAGQKGKVYLVIGSDTSIWDGLSTTQYGNRYFQSGLYSDPARNGYAVMDSSFRYQLRDSYGTPMKMTWWMMAGNVFHLSKNCNIPIRRNISLYLMKKYHADAIAQYDDQLSLHYHTYYWSDPQGDGKYEYEIAPDFLLNLDDYEQTLCSFLIEDNIFPISFRSGWMYMDEHWQAYQERFIPFDMSDCWTDISDGSEPFHPNADNYRLKGDMEQWRVRSEYFTVTSARERGLNNVFRAASEGKDQMICLWSHLPETEFLNGMDSVNAMAHRLSEQDTVDFMYCGDVEAMRLWINPEDTIAPVLTVNEIYESGGYRFDIQTDGPVFQEDEPFVAVKTVYETYERVACTKIADNHWETVKTIPEDIIAKVAVSVCDSVGNQANAHLSYLPDDVFVDDHDQSYSEISGTWSDYTSAELWDLNARRVNGEGKVEITPDIAETRTYAISFHGPGSDTDSLRCMITNSSLNDTVLFTERLLGRDKWQHVGFFDLESGSSNTISFENLNPDKAFGLDVVRITPLIADKHLVVGQDILTFDDVSVGDTATKVITLSNMGQNELTILSLSCYGSKIKIDDTFPMILEPMETRDIPIKFTSQAFCEYNDVITIKSDDPNNDLIYIPLFATSLSYYVLIDNDDPTGYAESPHAWFTSSAVASKATSRCVFNHSDQLGSYADFSTQLEISGRYDIRFIVPATSNAHTHASYIVMIDGVPQDTVFIDQNEGSGHFVSIGEFDLPKDVPVRIRVQNNGGSSTGTVLRADAIKLILIEEKFVSAINAAGVPDEFKLYQNFPNPFNPSTKIYFAVPERGEVRVDFFDLQGKKVDATFTQDMDAGFHYISWQPEHLSSGIYFYRVSTVAGQAVGRCTYLK